MAARGIGSGKTREAVSRICGLALNARSHPKQEQRDYKDYGGCGIAACERWLKFKNFLAEMGPKSDPKLALERRDVNGNYELSNCYWGTQEIQANNKRTNIFLTIDGRRALIKWATLSAERL